MSTGSNFDDRLRLRPRPLRNETEAPNRLGSDSSCHLLEAGARGGPQLDTVGKNTRGAERRHHANIGHQLAHLTEFIDRDA